MTSRSLLHLLLHQETVGQNMASLMDYTQTNMAAGASRPAAGRRQAPAVTNPAPPAMDEIIRVRADGC